MKNNLTAKINNKIFYITGATGLIGSNLVYTIIKNKSTKVIVQVRNKSKAKKLFGNKVKYVICDMSKKPKYNGEIDYIIHCANPTSSKYFVENPVETIKETVNGTMNMLEFAKEKKVKNFIYLSSMEVYGNHKNNEKIDEVKKGSFDSKFIRNSYPLSKLLCENLCLSYASEYGLHTKIIRLTQTFGPGINYNDKRIFAELARCAVERKNFVLKTAGKTKRSYLYIDDAVNAILFVLLKGKDGEIYNAANEESYCSIYEMAKLVANIGKIKVIIKKDDINKYGYADELQINLDTTKLKKLGWNSQTSLNDMYVKLIEYMKTIR